MDLRETIPQSGDGSFSLADIPGPPSALPTGDPESVATQEVAVEPVDAGPSFPAPTSRAEFPIEPHSDPDVEAATSAQAPDPAPVPPESGGAAAAPAPPEKPAEPAGPKLRRKRKAVRRPWDAPAWVVSALIHVGILGGLATMAASSNEIRKMLPNLDSSLVPSAGSAEEMVKIYADPSEVPRDQAVGSPDSPTAGAGIGYASNGAAPSSTPTVARSGRGTVNERTALPTMPTIAPPSGRQFMPSMPNRDLAGGGAIGGTVDFNVPEVGEALDQIAREILRHLTQHKVTVVWLFDESESMRDDQKEIKRKFDRVVNQLNINTPDDIPAPKGKKARSSGPPLGHAIVGFGDDIHFELEKPTDKIEVIGKAIDRLRIDSTGKENTMSAVYKVIQHYNGLISDDHKLLIVLVTDESGDDGDYVEEARQAAVSREVPIYVIGRQSLFGTGHLTLEYKDPVTNDVFWVGIRRGPETADLEALQYDGIHGRWDEIPAGFAPYELARLAKDSGGVFFILPTEESQRVRRREKAYSTETLKEYIPDYESRALYLKRREESTLRRTLFDIIQLTRGYPLRHHYPVMPEEMIPAIEQELPVVKARYDTLLKIEAKLRQIEKDRDREPEKRWQAAYDLMLAQIVAYQVKTYEYGANIQRMKEQPPKPSELPTPELFVDWSLDHSHERIAKNPDIQKKEAEAKRLFDLVIARHPNTPWADLARDEIDRGFSVKRNEWKHKHSTRYNERAKLVPKF